MPDDPSVDEPPSRTDAVPEPSTPDAEAEAAAARDTGAYEAFQQRARLAEDRLAEVLAAYRQLKTETEAHRERITRTVEQRYAGQRERLLLKFIDILDNLDRALEAAESTYAGEPLIEGLILVRTQLLQTLKEEGLERIPVLGLPYDPHTSEAVAAQAVDDPDQHQVVIKELMRGYRLSDRVARPSRVVVGQCDGGAAAGAPSPSEAKVPGDTGES